ncbi:MAG: hypothetical protein QM765_25930 [Myxococcales bacterium]
MFALPLLFALGAAQPSVEPVAVVVPLHVSGLSANESMGLALQIHQILSASGVPLATDPATALVKLGTQSAAADACQGEPDCAVALAKKLSVVVLIGVDAAAGKKACALHIEAVSAADGAKLGVIDLSSPREGLKAADKATLQAFAQEIAPKLAALAPPKPKLPEPPPPTDLPREADLRPPPPPDAPILGADIPSAPPAGARPAVVGTAVGAGIAAAAAIALGVVGYVQEPPQGPTPDLNWDQALARANTANVLYGSAGGAAGVAAVLAVVAVVLQLSE